MIIYDFDVQDIPGVPLEAHTPLVVDANTILSAPVTVQSFQAIRGRHTQILQCLRPIQHTQLAQRDLLNIGGQSARALALGEDLSRRFCQSVFHLRV